MPTGTTSYFSGSRAAITLPAEMHEIECSLRPAPEDHGDAGPAAVLRGASSGSPTAPRGCSRARPYRRTRPGPGRTRGGQYAGAHASRHPCRPRRSSPARARPAAQHPDHDGLDVRRRRGHGVRPLRQPDLARLRGGARRPRGRSLPRLLQRPGRRGHDPRPGRHRAEGGRAAARLQRLGDAARRPRGPRTASRRTSSTSATPRPWSRRATTPPWSGSSRRPTRPWRSPTSRRSPRQPTRPAPTSSSTTPSPPRCSSSRWTGTSTSSCTRRRSTSAATPTCSWARSSPATTSCTPCSRAAATSSARSPVPSRPGSRCAGCARCRCAWRRRQANAQELVRRLRERADVTEVRYPGFGAMIAIVLPSGGDRRRRTALDEAVGLRHLARRRRVDPGAPPPLEDRGRHHPRGPDPSLRRDRGRRGHLGGPEPGARRGRPLTPASPL